MKLRLADDLTLPVDAATQTFLIVGKRGSGKTSTGVRLSEQFSHAGVPFAVVDPVDVWWGLKASRSGGTGLGVYVFGGRHADLPLEPTAGGLIADVLVEHRISVVLSVKHFSGRERDRFMGDFAARLFQRNTEPLHLFLEEAHEVAPQHPYKGEEQMLHHVRRIWKLGRASGLGGSAITQRPASLDKNITTQAEILIVHRTIGPQDVAAIREWIRYHGEREDILAQLATLKTGEAFVWAPDFPERKPIGLQRVKVLTRETFDSSATPKAGESRVEPKALAPVDLERLRKHMASTIERAKAEDPRELRRQLAEARMALAKAQQAAPTPQATIRRVEVPVLTPRQIRTLRKIERLTLELVSHGTGLVLAGGKLEGLGKVLTEKIGQLMSKVAAGAREAGLSRAHMGADVDTGQRTPGRVLPPRPEGPPRQKPASPQPAVPSEGMSHSQQRILDALAWLESLDLTPASKTQVALLADQSPTSGGFFNNLGRLRSSWLIEYPAPSAVALTNVGRSLARAGDVPTTSAELHEQLYRRLSRSQAAILRHLIEVYPRAVGKPELAEAAGQSPTSGSYFNNLGRLRSLGLVDYPAPGQVVALPVLFLER